MNVCTAPAIEEFPRPIIPQYVRARGGLIFHLLLAGYMFLGLSIVCDDYFVPALERMVECKWTEYSSPCHLPPNNLALPFYLRKVSSQNVLLVFLFPYV